MDDERVQAFFSDKPIQYQLFGFLKKYVLSFGNVDIKVTKSQIAFSNKRQFAWVWLPMKWDKRRPKNCIVLSFSLPEKITHPQIVQVVESYPGRFIHHIILEKESDMNEAVRR